MAFKQHPYYDQSGADDWLPLPDDGLLQGDGFGPLATLVQTLRVEQERICAIALDRIRKHAGAEDLAERPHAERNEFLFFPIEERGFQVYVEYGFFPRPDETSPVVGYH